MRPAVVLTAIFVPETKSKTMRNIDPIGQGLAVVFLFGVVFTLIEGPGLRLDQPEGRRPSRWSPLMAFVAFLRYESRRDDPFIDLRFFRSIPFASATLTAVCAFSAWGAFLFMMSLYLQGERGYSAMHTGLIYCPDSHWRTGLLAHLGPAWSEGSAPGRPCSRPGC